MSVTYIMSNLLLQNELLEAKKMESDSKDKGIKSLLLLQKRLRLNRVLLDVKLNSLRVGSKLDQVINWQRSQEYDEGNRE